MIKPQPRPLDNANPGSPYALDHGCLCPRMDNSNGLGIFGGAKDKNGKVSFWISENCPMHGKGSDRPC